MHPSRKGLAVAALGLGLSVLPALGLASLWPAWVFFWALLLLFFGLDLVLAMRARDIQESLRLPDMLHVGATGVAHLELSVRSRSTPAEIKLDLSDNLTPQPARRGVLSKEGASFEFPLLPTRRGNAAVEAAWVRYEGPFGLIVREVRIPMDRSVSVVPNVPSVRAAALQFFSDREYRAGLKIERFVGDGTEFDVLRDYAPGLDRRSIDWKASARHTRLLSRQFRAERSHQVVLVVDTGRLMAEPLEGIPRLDHAVHAALLLAYFSARSGDRVSLYAFDERPRTFIAPKSGFAAFRALLQRSGALEYSTAETNYTLGLTQLQSHLTRRSLVIVLTDFVDTVTAELMIENLHRLSKRHLVIFVALRDPLLSELCGERPKTLAHLNRAVVADSLLFDREVVLKRLMRRGVFCIDAPPRRIGVDLVNRYLEIKRRELI